VVSYAKLRSRLYTGRPIVLDADIGASLRARGFEMDGPGALGAILHRDPQAVSAHHQAELSCNVDILSALTADTTPRALAEAAMEHRAARLTGIALELLSELTAAWPRPVGVAGVLGSELVSATQRGRFEDETLEHAARIAAGGADLMIIRGMGSRLDLVFAVAAAANHGSAWAVVDRYMVTDEELPRLALSLTRSTRPRKACAGCDCWKARPGASSPEPCSLPHPMRSAAFRVPCFRRGSIARWN
jgi:methionine synthase I (cobalamin-dependent)